VGCWCGQILPSTRAEVAEVDFTAFTRLASQRTPGRLVVRRIPDLTPRSTDGQGTLFDTWRFAYLKASALAHRPSGRFAANSAWLVLAVMAFNLTRAAATLTGTRPATATTATIRRTLISVPARIAPATGLSTQPTAIGGSRFIYRSYVIAAPRFTPSRFPSRLLA
jgi:hypothetical protein